MSTMTITTEQIKELREATGAGIMDCREALEKTNGDFEKALEYLREKGFAKAAKRADRDAAEGMVELYSHGEGRVGVMVEVNCETDFVARAEPFRNLAHEISLQIAAMAPRWISEDDIPEEVLDAERVTARRLAKEDGKPDSKIESTVEESLEKFKKETCLLRQAYIRDEKVAIQDLINENIGSIGENIVIRRFERWELGENAAE